MPIESIHTTPQFDKHYRALAKAVKTAAKEKEALFRLNPYNLRLRTHKLHGKDAGAWAFWINQKYRIKFLFVTERSVLFLDIGTHDIYS